jgi:putative endopeptidase
MRLSRWIVLAGLATQAVGAAGQAPRTLGIDTTNFDRSVRPQDDFYRFVNGGWLRRTQIPADVPSWGSFAELNEKSRQALRAILEDLVGSKASAGGEGRKIADVYASFMDSAAVERLGITPLAGEFDFIASIQNTPQLPAAFAYLMRIGVRLPFVVTVQADPMQSSVNTVVIGQHGLGMPDRDYYLLPDAKMAATRQAYQEYMSELLTLARRPDPAGSAARVLALETALASKQWDRARSRDRNATYNRMTVQRLAALSPSYSWSTHLAMGGLVNAKTVVVRQPDYITGVDSIVAATPASVWREYFTVHLLDAYADELPAGFVNARFEFRGRVLAGQRQIAERWKRGVAEVQGIVGDALGKLYVERHFRPAAKARMDTMIQNLIAAYRVGIDSLEWMSPATKAQATDKLSRFSVKIGYPAKYKDYTGLITQRGNLFANARRSRTLTYDKMIADLGKPVDRSRWTMTPQTVNAYYQATNNEIVFPAAILQPPFFDLTADDAANYGAIGAVIGHEIGHGFDDQGRKSDGLGNLRDWWTAADAAAFEARAAKLGAQYEAISPVEGMRINPRLTMGENIGDLSGLAQAYRAYRISLGGKDPPVIGGFTGDQRFFMGFAQIWRAIAREEYLRQQLLSDSHSPAAARGFVPFVNNEAFLRAWSVKPGDKMWLAPADRVKIW